MQANALPFNTTLIPVSSQKVKTCFFSEGGYVATKMFDLMYTPDI